MEGSELERFAPIVPSEKMVVLSKVAALKSALERLTPERFVPVKSVPERFRFDKLAALEGSELERLAHMK